MTTFNGLSMCSILSDFEPQRNAALVVSEPPAFDIDRAGLVIGLTKQNRESVVVPSIPWLDPDQCLEGLNAHLVTIGFGDRRSGGQN